jgi:hypothetical protein
LPEPPLAAVDIRRAAQLNDAPARSRALSRERDMPKGTKKEAKNNKPKLTTAEKQKKKKEKAEAKK